MNAGLDDPAPFAGFYVINVACDYSFSQHLTKNTCRVSADVMKNPETLDALLRNSATSVAERKLASAFAENYPTSALGTVEALATRADVSGPTVLRYLTKLGFPRFADFQNAVMMDINRQLGSPLMQIETATE